MRIWFVGGHGLPAFGYISVALAEVGFDKHPRQARLLQLIGLVIRCSDAGKF